MSCLFWCQCLKDFRDELKTSRGGWPEYGKILTFKLIGQIYSSTDTESAIISASSLYLCQCLSRCPIGSFEDVKAGLVVISTLMDYYQLTNPNDSKSGGSVSSRSCQTRVVPEIFIFLRRSLAFLMKQCNGSEQSEEDGKIMGSSSPAATTVSIALASLIQLVLQQYDNFVASPEIFSPTLKDLRTLVTEERGGSFINIDIVYINDMEEKIQNVLSTRQALRWREVGVNLLKSLEPRMETNYTLKTATEQSNAAAGKNAEQLEYKQLQKKARREKKAVARELRRDSQYLSQEKYAAEQVASQARKDLRHANYAQLGEDLGQLNRFVKGEMKIALSGGGSGGGPKRRRG